MKRSEHKAHIRNLSLADLQQHIVELEKKIQAQQLAVAFGKSKQVSTVGNLKRELAQSLTIANQKLQATTSEEK